MPNRRWRTCTLLGALAHDGLVASMMVSMVVEGAMDRAAFELFVERFLLPVLVPGQIVVMDNLSSHKGRRVRQLIRGAGCRCVYLPAYSWDLNPIEQAFAKLKQGLRGVAARTVRTLIEAAGRTAATLSRTDALSYFRHCGYHSLPATHADGLL
ncbi:MAG: transposase [Planctomycetota bacterium]